MKVKVLTLSLIFLVCIIKAQNCNPHASINSLKVKGEISRKLLAQVGALNISVKCGTFSIISYEFGARIKEDSVVYYGKGPGLTDDIKSTFSKASIIWFDNISVKNKDGKLMNAEKLVLTIKN